MAVSDVAYDILHSIIGYSCYAPLENELTTLDERDPDAQLQQYAARFAEDLGVDPSALNMRRVDARADEPNPLAEERERLRDSLGHARALLQRLVSPGLRGDTPSIEATTRITDVARTADCALVYLMVTVHGAVALVALPSGDTDLLLLDKPTSDVITTLVYGTNNAVGFVDAVRPDNLDALPDCLNAIADALRGPLFARLRPWLDAHEVADVVLVPLGSLGLLPLHVAAGDLVFSYAPSAEALRAAAASQPSRSGLLLLADPTHDDMDSLPFAVAEARAIQALAPKQDPAVALVGPDATSAAVHHWAPGSRHVHFGCHGRFRPSEPLASELLLAGTDRVTVADVFSGEIDLSTSELVTLLACQSGNAEFRYTPDECLSFPGALLVGGVRSSVSTMWPVDDDAAALFSVKLYELIYRDELAPADAVTQARVWLRTASAEELLTVVRNLRSHLTQADSDIVALLDQLAGDLAHSSERHPYGHPDLWASFILTGFPRN